MPGTSFLETLLQSHAARVARLETSGLLGKPLPKLTVRERLGAIALDLTDLGLRDMLRGTTVLCHEDVAVVDCLVAAVRRLHGDDVELLQTGSRESAYDSACDAGKPIVAICWSRRGLEPYDIVTLADRDIDVPDVGRADAIARLTWSVTGAEVWLSDSDAARFGASSLMRCVQLGSTTAECERRLRAWLEDADRMAGTVKETESKMALSKLAPVSVGDAAADVVKRLSQMTGFGEAGTWGINLGRDLRDYRDGKLPWSDVDRGILLSGPPGCGKTTFAKALALECEVDLVSTTYAEWSAAGGAAGDSMSKGLTKLFDGWRKKAESGPFILFIDEMDSMGKRGGNAHNESWYAPVVNGWLAFLDGAVPRDGIVVVGATNHPSRVDPAMLRPGRLDRHVELPMPDVEDLAGVIRAHLGPDAMLTDDELAEAARAVRGRSPADVQLMCREARRVARWCKRRVCASDLTDVAAMHRGVRDPGEERQTAVHEAGHAVAAIVLGVDKLTAVDIDRGKASLVLRAFSTRSHVQDRLVMFLAARACEELILGAPTTGASLDLEDATAAAMQMHASWGMGSLGLVSLSQEVALADRTLRDAVRETLDAAYARALDLVRTHRAAIERVAEALIKRRYLDGGEVLALVTGPMPAPPPGRRSAPSMGGRVTRHVGPVTRQGPS